MNNTEIEYKTRTKIKGLLDITNENQIRDRIGSIVRNLWNLKSSEFNHKDFQKISWDFTLYADIEGNIQVTNCGNFEYVFNANLPQIMIESESFADSLKSLEKLGTKLDENNSKKIGYIEIYLTVPLEVKFNEQKRIIEYKYPSFKDIEFFLSEYISWIRSEAITAYYKAFEMNI